MGDVKTDRLRPREANRAQLIIMTTEDCAEVIRSYAGWRNVPVTEVLREFVQDGIEALPMSVMRKLPKSAQDALSRLMRMADDDQRGGRKHGGR